MANIFDQFDEPAKENVFDQFNNDTNTVVLEKLSPDELTQLRGFTPETGRADTRPVPIEQEAAMMFPPPRPAPTPRPESLPKPMAFQPDPAMAEEARALSAAMGVSPVSGYAPPAFQVAPTPPAQRGSPVESIFGPKATQWIQENMPKVSAKEYADATDVLAVWSLAAQGKIPFNQINERLAELKTDPNAAMKIAAGAQQATADAVSGTINFFTSPLGVATLGTGALVPSLQRATSAAFTVDMARHAPEQLAKLDSAIKTGDAEQVSKAAGDLAITAGFVYGAGKHALQGKGEMTGTMLGSMVEKGQLPPGVIRFGQGPRALVQRADMPETVQPNPFDMASRLGLEETAKAVREIAEETKLPEAEVLSREEMADLQRELDSLTGEKESTAIQKEDTLGNGKSSSDKDKLQTGTQAESRINRETAANDVEATQGRIKEASDAWLEAVSRNDTEAISNAETSLLGEPMGAEELQRLRILVGADVAGTEIRASGGYGELVRKAAAQERARTSQESKQLGQQAGELATSESRGAHEASREATKKKAIEDAIFISKAAGVPVRETPQDRGAMAEGVRPAAELAGEGGKPAGEVPAPKADEVLLSVPDRFKDLLEDGVEYVGKDQFGNDVINVDKSTMTIRPDLSSQQIQDLIQAKRAEMATAGPKAGEATDADIEAAIAKAKAEVEGERKTAKFGGYQMGIPVFEVPGARPGWVSHVSAETAIQRGFEVPKEFPSEEAWKATKEEKPAQPAAAPAAAEPTAAAPVAAESAPPAPAPAKPEVKQEVAAKPAEAAETSSFLDIPEPDITEERIVAKRGREKIKALNDELERIRKEMVPIRARIMTTRKQNRYSRGGVERVKSSAKPADVNRFRELERQGQEIVRQQREIQNTFYAEDMAVQRADHIRKMRDTSAPMIERIAARVSLDALDGKETPAANAQFRRLAEAEVRKRVPDVTAEELERAAREVEVTVRLEGLNGLDHAFNVNPALRIMENRAQRTRDILENIRSSKGWIWEGDHPRAAELRKQFEEIRFGDEKAKTEQAIQKLRDDLAVAEKEIQAEDEAKRIRDEEAARQNSIRESQMMDEAQSIVDSKPRGRDAKEVKDELIQRIEKSMDELIEESGVTVTREAGRYIAKDKDGRTSAGEVWRDGERYVIEVRNYEVGGGVTDRFTVDTLDEAMRLLKVHAATSPGKTVIAVPGDGIFRFNKHGPSMAQLWKRAGKISTAGGGEGGGGGVRGSGKPKSAPALGKGLTAEETLGRMRKLATNPDKPGFGDAYSDGNRAIATDGLTFVEIKGEFPKSEETDFPLADVERWLSEHDADTSAPATVPTADLWRIAKAAEKVERSKDEVAWIELFVDEKGNVAGQSANKDGDVAGYGSPEGKRSIGFIRADTLSDFMEFARKLGHETITIARKDAKDAEATIWGFRAGNMRAFMSGMTRESEKAWAKEIGAVISEATAPTPPKAAKPAKAPKAEEKPAEAKPAKGKAKLSEREKLLQRIEGIELNPEANKSAAVAVARKAFNIGLLDDRTWREVQRVAKDRDMGVEDVLNEFKGRLEKPPGEKMSEAEITANTWGPGRRGEEELGRFERGADPFERARKGEETAFDDLDSQFREIYPDEGELALGGRMNPNEVRTPEAFVRIFDKAFAERDFDTILDAIKATSDVSIWKPYLKKLFSEQGTDPVSAQKAEWFRHVFNGTRPPDAVPPKAPKPPPASTPPPPRPGPSGGGPRPGAGPSGGGAPPPGGGPRPGPTPPPPGPTPTRIPVAPLANRPAKSPYRILEDFSRAIEKDLRILRMPRGVLGVYRPGSTTTAQRFAGDLDTAAHELAGHWTDDRHGIGKPWIAPGTRSPYDAELAKFWIFGSVTPRRSLAYRRAEGIAEYIRAYVMNPDAAKAEAPNFTAYFEQTLPPGALKSIKNFSDDVRSWAGADPLLRAGLNIRMSPPKLRERLWNFIRGRGYGFETNPIDRVREMFDDPYHYAVKAANEVNAIRGRKPLPQDDFELLSRLLATHDDRMMDQFNFGFTKLRPKQIPNARTGELEVERLIDSVTGKPMNQSWLLEPYNTESPAKLVSDMRDVSAYMVAERTLELAKKTGKTKGLSGLGAGVFDEIQEARDVIRRVQSDPQLKAKIEEGARRYRLLADQNFQMLVDAGRLTPETAAEIRKNNQAYVDMHRLSLDFETSNRAQRGGLATRRDIQKQRGSNLEIENVFANLYEQIDSIQKEAHRNVVMNAFVDNLRNLRSLHGANRMDLDQWGRKASSKDRNVLRVFKNGKLEHWQFDPEIYRSLKGLGELGTNSLFATAVAPMRFVRYMITHGIPFMLRNPSRDAFERSVHSATGSKPWNIFEGYSQAELSRYEVFGGGQFGNYIVDRHVWHRELERAIEDLTKKPGNIVLNPLRLKEAWENLAQKSEKLGRIAEFRSAFKHGREKLGYDDYNAALYAAGQARGLLDFAKAGTVMKYVNQAIPFSNARLRGLAKSLSRVREDPVTFWKNWSMYVLAPTIAIMLWNRRDENVWKEYLQLPAYRRDFFWNLKVGDHWLMFPKSHLLGVLAGGVERMLLSIAGEKASGEGYGESLKSAVAPVSSIAETAGPLKTLLELAFNRDSFRNRDIVPVWERDLDLNLREGTQFASGAGRGIAGALNTTGLSIDPRQVDHVLNSLGGWGNLVTKATGKNITPKEVLMSGTGAFTESPGTNARDVQFVLDWARKKGKLSTSSIRRLQDLRKAVFEAPADDKEAARVRLREFATRLRARIESTQTVQ